MIKHLLYITIIALSSWLTFSCDDYYKNDYYDNSPTSGKLKLYHSEGLSLHVRNQAQTFLSQYHNANIDCIAATESEAIDAFLKDSCKAIIINRLLSESEQKAFLQKQITPRYSALAKTGVALIINSGTKINILSVDQIKQLLNGELIVRDSLSNLIKLTAIIDNKNSDVSHYILDSVLHTSQFGENCFAVSNSLELIEKISTTPNTIGFLDFAWLSDVDDPLFKKYHNQIKFISVGRTDSIYFAPNQSSFKTGEYPFIRTIYLLRRSDDFSLAKGFEAFEAGPKGQLTYLKQGLLPMKQAERNIEINLSPLNQ